MEKNKGKGQRVIGGVGIWMEVILNDMVREGLFQGWNYNFIW